METYEIDINHLASKKEFEAELATLDRLARTAIQRFLNKTDEVEDLVENISRLCDSRKNFLVAMALGEDIEAMLN